MVQQSGVLLDVNTRRPQPLLYRLQALDRSKPTTRMVLIVVFETITNTLTKHRPSASQLIDE
jgi:hypothetical protein